MARSRNFKAEYQRRLAKGRAKGVSVQEARGHGPVSAPEHPVRAFSNPFKYFDYIRSDRRFDKMVLLAQSEEGRRRLGKVNRKRQEEGKGPIVIDYPPYPGPGARQTTFESFAEAEPHGSGIPPEYTVYYLSPEGVTLEIRRGVRHHRRAA